LSSTFQVVSIHEHYIRFLRSRETEQIIAGIISMGRAMIFNA
jgi:hypothetical protein